MRYELRISAICGDVIPLCLVAEAMARAASTAYGKTPPHKPIFDYQLPTQTKHLLNEARAGRLHVCNQDGVQGAADEIIAAAKSSGDLSEVRRYLEEPGGATEIDWDTTNILILYSKLHCLNEWGKTRGDSFFISDEPVGWIDERGYMNPTGAPAAKVEAGAAITTHKLKTKNMPLDAEIATAKTRALDKTNVQSVWDELVKMANKQEGCLIGEGDLNELQYGSRQAPEIFKKRQLTDRMRGRKGRAKPHQSSTSRAKSPT